MKHLLVFTLLVFCFPVLTFGQSDTLVDCFPLAVGNQWTYAYDHLRTMDTGAGNMYTSDTGKVSYTVTNKTSLADSTVWTVKEQRRLRHLVTWGYVREDTTIVDSTVFGFVEQLTGRHALYRSNGEQGLLWKTVFPFLRDMSDTTLMYRYWRVSASQTHTFKVRYPSPNPVIAYEFIIRKDSGLVAMRAWNAMTFEGAEFSNHRLVGQTITGAANPEATSPLKVHLYQNYPNPFNPSTTITYQLPTKSFVSLKVYDVLGREVETLVEHESDAGLFSVEWDSKQASSGVYFYRMSANGNVQTNRMLVLK
ncbi:MAG: T9SS type A sorting domain-containing protein [Ignavibacteriae bacterium]|nr:T9SS type A sorting domain-containing protein [Ignavibacteriota bacterium]